MEPPGISGLLYVGALEIFVVVILYSLVDKGVLTIRAAIAIAMLFLVLGVALDYKIIDSGAAGMVAVAVLALLLVAVVAFDLAMRRSGKQGLTVEPEWKWSQQEVSKTGTDGQRDKYSLQTALCARFANADDVSHIVRAARLTLLRRRRVFGAVCIGESSEPLFFRKAEAQRDGVHLLEGSGSGIKVEAHSLGEHLYFEFMTPLPDGTTSLDERHLARIRFQILGESDFVLDLPVHCPRPFELIGYDYDGRPVQPGLERPHTDSAKKSRFIRRAVVASLLIVVGSVSWLTLRPTHYGVPNPPTNITIRLAPTVVDAAEIERRTELLRMLTNEYLLTHKNVSPQLKAGTEHAPIEWLNQRLAELHRDWRVKDGPTPIDLIMEK